MQEQNSVQVCLQNPQYLIRFSNISYSETKALAQLKNWTAEQCFINLATSPAVRCSYVTRHKRIDGKPHLGYSRTSETVQFQQLHCFYFELDVFFILLTEHIPPSPLCRMFRTSRRQRLETGFFRDFLPTSGIANNLMIWVYSHSVEKIKEAASMKLYHSLHS